MNHAERDILISQVIDGEADDQQWNHLQEIAAVDPSVWHDLAEMQRQHHAMSLAMTEAAYVAERVAVPRWRPVVRLGAWGGWAVAAVLVLAWVTTLGQPASIDTGGATPIENTRQVAGFTSITDAIQAYLNDDNSPEKGEVLKELPAKVLVNSRPLPAGEGYELVYVRQVLERTVVPDLFEFEGQDERGQSRLIRVQHHRGGAM